MSRGTTAPTCARYLSLDVGVILTTMTSSGTSIASLDAEPWFVVL
jgi:hypothetical protein